MTDELFTLTRPQRAAYAVLFDAPEYARRPCKDNPQAWDNTTPANIVAAMNACKTCPVLAQCRAVVDSGVQIDGVVAGQIHGRKELSTRVDIGRRQINALARAAAGESTHQIATDLKVARRTVNRWIAASHLARTNDDQAAS